MDFPNEDGYNDVYAIDSLCLGKNSYIDILEYVNDKGHTIHDHHVRMNGFPTSCIEYYANKQGMSVVYVYNNLYDNQYINIDLTNQHIKFVFISRNTPDYDVTYLCYGDKGTTITCQYIRGEEQNVFIN